MFFGMARYAISLAVGGVAMAAVCAVCHAARDASRHGGRPCFATNVECESPRLIIFL